jgi:hypothetical protein
VATYHFAGYSSLYPFYCFPERIRLRLRYSQAHADGRAPLVTYLSQSIRNTTTVPTARSWLYVPFIQLSGSTSAI